MSVQRGDTPEVVAELTRALFRHARSGAVGALVAMLFSIVVMYFAGLGPLEVSPFAVAALAYAHRLWLIERFHRAEPPEAELGRWHRAFFFSSLTAGVALGSTGFLVFPVATPALQLYVLLAVGGVAAGAVVVNAAAYGTVVVYTGAALGGLGAGVAVYGFEGEHWTAALVALYAIVVLRSGWQANRTIAHAVELGLENRALVAELVAERDSAEAAKKAAEEASRAKTEFVTRMSHEIRTPLNGVLGMTELLLGGALRTEERFFAEAANHSGQTLLRVVDDILEFERLEAGKVTIERSSFVVEDLLEDVLALHGPAAAKKGLVLAHHVAPALPKRLFGDPIRIRQVLTNLVSNAIKFTEKGEVEIVAEPGSNAGSQRFSVRDTGMGIEPYARARLFQRFEQADQTIHRRFGGSGLGLAIVRQLVELMGGAVAVESEVGAGTTIAFTLNLDEDPAPVAPPPFSLEKRSIAVWARHPLHVRALDAWLRELGAEVVPVRSADELARRVANGVRVAIVDQGAAGETASLVLRNPGLRLVTFDAPGQIAGSGPTPVRRMSTPLTRTQLVRALAELEDRGPGDVGVRAFAPRPRFEGARILVVDDNAVNRTVLRGMLGRLGVSPVMREDGASALAAMLEERFDLVFMDCELPDLDGTSVTRSVRDAEREKSAPPQAIVAVTAHVLETHRTKCLEAGMNDLLTKPVSFAALEACLTRWVPRTPSRDLPEPLPPKMLRA